MKWSIKEQLSWVSCRVRVVIDGRHAGRLPPLVLGNSISIREILHRNFGILILIAAATGGPANAFALTSSSAPATQAQIDALQKAVQNAQSAGDNAWMLVSAALVLLMTGPGLALFYGGLVGKKEHPRHDGAVFRHEGAGHNSVGCDWVLSGIRARNAFVGGFEHIFLRGVGLGPSPYAGTIPAQHGLPADVCHYYAGAHYGAFAERMKFSAMALFLALWSLLVYSPMAHTVGALADC